jgi:hypothetical protein
VNCVISHENAQQDGLCSALVLLKGYSVSGLRQGGARLPRARVMGYIPAVPFGTKIRSERA